MMMKSLCMGVLLCGTLTLSASSVDSAITSTDSTIQVLPDSMCVWATKVTSTQLKNLYKLNDSMYRCEQPNSKEMRQLEQLGIRSILNLRESHTDNSEAKGTSLKLYHYRWAASKISEDDLMRAMRTIKFAPKPIVVHCWHGSDRTGAVAAAYRICFMNWNVESAIKELKDGPYGHHESIYPNIERLFRKIDWEVFKQKLDQYKD